MRALVIVVAVSVLLELSSSALREPVINDDKRNTRQLLLGPSPLNPFYTPIYNRTAYGQGLLPASDFSPYSSHFGGPSTFHLSPREGVTIIPNAEPQAASYQTSQGFLNSQIHPSSQGISSQQNQLNSQQKTQTRVQAALQKRIQFQQQQYQQQLQQAAQNAHALPQAQSTAQPLYYQQSDPLAYQGYYSTPAPTVFSSSLYDIPAQQFPNLIDQGYFKYPVYIDPNLANNMDGMAKPMFMKKRTLHDLCAAYAPEEKTVIYVLSQNPGEPPEEIEVPKVPQPTKPSKPEVYFVKYNTPEEAELAQKHIQAQYDKLGGTSEVSNEGVSPIAHAQDILNGAHNLTRQFPLLSNHLRH